MLDAQHLVVIPPLLKHLRGDDRIVGDFHPQLVRRLYHRLREFGLVVIHALETPPGSADRTKDAARARPFRHNLVRRGRRRLRRQAERLGRIRPRGFPTLVRSPQFVSLFRCFLQRDAALLLVTEIARQVRASRLMVGDRRLHRLDARCERAARVNPQLTLCPIEKIEHQFPFGFLDCDPLRVLAGCGVAKKHIRPLHREIQHRAKRGAHPANLRITC